MTTPATRAPRLTVGIPTFNRAEWLYSSIQSVLAQGFTDFQLIISDNASTDHTRTVVSSFSDRRIRYVRSDHNIGAIANINRLIELTDSEFLLLLPDDDVLYPDHLAAAVDVLDRSPTIGLVHSAFNQVDESGHVIRRVDPVPCRARICVEDPEPALERLMMSRWGLCFPSVVYRTRALIQAGKLRQEDEPFGDRKLWMRLATEWHFGYISEPSVGFRAHPSGITTRIASEEGASRDYPERFAVYSDINFQKRMEFLDEASLSPRMTGRLRSLARLQYLIDSADLGLPRMEVLSSAMTLGRTCPQILRQRALWHLLAAEFGARRARQLLRSLRWALRPTAAGACTETAAMSTADSGDVRR